MVNAGNALAANLICNGEWNLGRLTRFPRQFDKKLRRMAQEIVVTQQEIAAMRLAVGEPLPAQAPSPNQQVSTTNVSSKSGFQ
jgi:hypothetical protein